jgi:tetratricopeptide (TPR) repeat protein
MGGIAMNTIRLKNPEPADSPLLEIPLSLNSLVKLYDGDSDALGQAEPLFNRELAADENALGPEHRDVAHRLQKLADIYRSLGRYAEARPLFERALGIFEKVYGPDHPIVAFVLNYLAAMDRSEGEFAEAELNCNRALAIIEAVFPADHPCIPPTISNLAALRYQQRKYPEAERLYRRAAAIWEKNSMGVYHLELAANLNNLATVYRELGRFTEAEDWYRRALRVAQHALGPQSQSLVRILENYRSLLKTLGRGEEAAHA